MDIDIEILIEEVEKRPLIYNTKLPEYHDGHLKAQNWEEICFILHNRWSTIDIIEKSKFGKAIQKKWKSLRDCFRRELSSQHISLSTGIPRKKSKYKYFDKLTFLVPFTQVTNSESSHDTTDTDNPSNSNRKNKKSSEESSPNHNKKQKKDCKQEILSVLKRKGNNVMKDDNTEAVQENNIRTINDDDEDKLFLLSLLPSFKNSTMEEKYLLRIEIMQTIMKFKQSRREVWITADNIVKKERIDDDEEEDDDEDDDDDQPGTSKSRAPSSFINNYNDWLTPDN